MLDQDQGQVYGWTKRDTEESSANPKGKEGAQGLLSNLSLLTDLSARP